MGLKGFHQIDGRGQLAAADGESEKRQVCISQPDDHPVARGRKVFFVSVIPHINVSEIIVGASGIFSSQVGFNPIFVGYVGGTQFGHRFAAFQ
jgi:hypothetical protein